jgi:thioredoxin-like negative regulator of GroEL
VGKVDATVEQNIANQMGIQGYPTIFFVNGKSKVPYEGARDADSIA